MLGNLEAVVLEVGLLTIKPDQVLVVRWRTMPTWENADRYMAEYFEAVLPGTRVMILPPIDLDVIDKVKA